MNKKAIAALILSGMIVTSSFSGAYASEKQFKLDNLNNTQITELNQKSLSALSKQVTQLEDKEYTDFVVNLIDTKGYVQAKEDLSKLNINLNRMEKDKKIQSRKLEAWQVDQEVYAVDNPSNTGEFTIIGKVTFDRSETKPATYDVIGIYFDPDKVTYKSSYVSNDYVASVKDVNRRDDGAVLFNVHDKNVGPFTTKSVYGAVKVRCTEDRSSIAMDYNHTYATTDVTHSLKFEGEYKSGKPGGLLGYEVQIKEGKGGVWQVADTGTIRFR